MTAHSAQFTLTYVDDEVPATARFSLDKALALRELADHITALSGGRRTGTVAVLTDNGSATRATGSVALSGVGGTAATGSYALSGVGGTAATGSVTLSDVGGTAATGTVTLAGGAGDVTVVVAGNSVGPVAFNTDDDTTAIDVAAAINLDVGASGFVSATALNSVITLTANDKGTNGNLISLTASRTAGSATASAATLENGANGNVTVVLNGTSVGPTDTTNISDTAAATAVAAALEADGTVGALMAAVGNGADVEITWGTKGTVGNAVTLTASTDTGTATASGATLTGGAQGAVTVVINGTSVGPVDTTDQTDTAAATTVAAAIEADGTLGPLLAAVGSTTNVNLTWGVKGTVGNAVTLAAGVSATGTATRSGATLSGGAQGSVVVTIGGTGVTTDTTDLTDTAATTAVAAAITANATVNKWVTASGASTTVTLTAILYGLIGNSISLTSTTATGTAIASGATLSGGTADTSAVTVTF